MIKLSTIKIKNSRQYFLLRLLAWVGTKSPFLMRIIYFGIRNKKVLPFDDVEAVYAHLDIERESENISFIKAIFRSNKTGTMYDFGANYMQFASALSQCFNQIRCFDPNSKVLELGKKYYERSNMEINSVAIIPSSFEKGDCYFVESIHNSGLSAVIFSEPPVKIGQVTHRIHCSYVHEIISPTSSSNDLLKIDVEGLENLLVNDAIKLSNFKGIICFESLTQVSRQDFSDTFEKLDYIFYVVKYNFSDFSGLMPNSFGGLLKAIITNQSSMVVYKSSLVNDFDFEFIPLLFCVPRALEKKVDDSILFINGNL